MADAPLTASASAPSWALPALLAALTGLGTGAIGATVSSEQPAVLASQLTGIQTDMKDMDAKLDRLFNDQYTRGDYAAFRSSDFAPLRVTVEEHVRSEGHPVGIRRLQDLEGKLAEVERRIRELESRK